MFQFETSEYHGLPTWSNANLNNFDFSYLIFFKLKKSKLLV